MSRKQRNYPRNESVEVREDSAGYQPRDKGKKGIKKRKFVLECVLGFSFGLLTRLLPVDALLLLLLGCLLLLVFLAFILLSS